MLKWTLYAGASEEANENKPHFFSNNQSINFDFLLN